MGTYTSVPLEQNTHQQHQEAEHIGLRKQQSSQDTTDERGTTVPQDRLGDYMTANCVGGVPDDWLEYHRTVQKLEPARRMSQLPLNGVSPWGFYSARKAAEAARPPYKKLPPLRKSPCLRAEAEDNSWRDFVPAPEDSDDDEDDTPGAAPRWGARTRAFFKAHDANYRAPVARPQSPLRIYAGFTKEEIEAFERDFDAELESRAAKAKRPSSGS